MCWPRRAVVVTTVVFFRRINSLRPPRVGVIQEQQLDFFQRRVLSVEGIKRSRVYAQREERQGAGD